MTNHEIIDLLIKVGCVVSVCVVLGSQCKNTLKELRDADKYR